MCFKIHSIYCRFPLLHLSIKPVTYFIHNRNLIRNLIRNHNRNLIRNHNRNLARNHNRNLAHNRIVILLVLVILQGISTNKELIRHQN